MRAFTVLLLLWLALPAFAQSGANVVPTDGTTLDNPMGEVGVTFLEPVNPAASRILLDGVDVTARAICTDSQVRYLPSQALSIGKHEARVLATAVSGRYFDLKWTFNVTDRKFNPTPADGSTPKGARPEIGATFFEPVKTTTVRLYVDGQDVTGMSRVSDSQVRMQPGSDFSPGRHTARVTANAQSGRAIDGSWSFTIGKSTGSQGGLFNPTPADGSSPKGARPEIGATFYEPVKTTTVRLFVDGQDVTGMCRVSDSQVRMQPGSDFSPGRHTARVMATTQSGQAIDGNWSFNIVNPTGNQGGSTYLANVVPRGVINNRRPEVGATFSQPVRPNSVQLYLDGATVTSQSTVTDGQVRFDPSYDLRPGEHQGRVVAMTTSGQLIDQSWSFSISGSSSSGSATGAAANPAPADGATISSISPEIGATFLEPVQTQTVRLFVNGQDMTRSAQVTSGQVRYRPGYLAPGTYNARVLGMTTSGRSIDRGWRFSVR
ncbi:MAG: hypothetical protein AMXMBFR33_08050 [Candidatus Xenobia bacterium]